MNPALKGNMRDHANVHQLVCLANLEAMNAHFIDQGVPSPERLVKLNKLAIKQMRVLAQYQTAKKLESKKEPITFRTRQNYLQIKKLETINHWI